MSVLRPNLVSPQLENVVTLLREQGFTTVTQILSQEIDEIMQSQAKWSSLGNTTKSNTDTTTSSPSRRIKPKDLLSLKKELSSKFSGLVENGLQLHEKSIQNTFKVSTGCQRLDEILNGGLISGQVTEICGGIAAGKTQFCLGCVCTAVRSGYNVYYIDTSSSFSPTRILEILRREQCKDIELLLSCIQHRVCSDIFEIFDVLQDICTSFSDQRKEKTKSKVLVIDCIASVIYPILGGSQIDGYGLLVKLGQKLKYIAVQYSVVVLITNNIVYTEGGKGVPSLGRAWSHVPHTRLKIESSSSDNLQCKVTLIKSSQRLVPEECLYYIAKALDE